MTHPSCQGSRTLSRGKNQANLLEKVAACNVQISEKNGWWISIKSGIGGFTVWITFAYMLCVYALRICSAYMPSLFRGARDGIVCANCVALLYPFLAIGMGYGLCITLLYIA